MEDLRRDSSPTAQRRSRPARLTAFRAAGSLVLLCLLGQPARAEHGSLGALTVGIGASMGFQVDERACDTAGSARTLAGGKGCALFLGGVDGSFLWRGAVGASLGLWSVSGQSAVAQGQPPNGQAPAAFPDRISVPLLIDLRPLAFAKLGEEGSYLRRLSHGVRLALGPSFEIVRTSSDSSFDFGNRMGSLGSVLFGLHGSLDGELPLLGSQASSLSLRLSLRFLHVPVIVLNDGAVQSALISRSDLTPNMLAMSPQGYTSHFQFGMGFVYYL